MVRHCRETMSGSRKAHAFSPRALGALRCLRSLANYSVKPSRLLQQVSVALGSATSTGFWRLFRKARGGIHARLRGNCPD